MHAATPLTLVILAAGRATRYGRLKQLESVGPHGAALLDYNIFDALPAGFRRIVVVVPHQLETRFLRHLRDQFGSDLDVTCVAQATESLPPGRSTPWGTAHAVLSVAAHLTTPFAVINGDDAYGRSAFATVASHMRAHSGEGCLAAYPLATTLSAHGGVSRGICDTDHDGYLIGLTEAAGVERAGTAIVGRAVGGSLPTLRDDTPTSMNLWGFPAVIVAQLERRWRAFADANGTSATAEFLLSTAVNDLVRGGTLRLRVLTTDAEWFGLTFPSDLDDVRRRVAHRVASGHYPEHLSHSLS
jgi:dTDP-glucose pyrophosphorylase